jgi:hypothetical protein
MVGTIHVEWRAVCPDELVFDEEGDVFRGL